jgi:hypothetical protein
MSDAENRRIAERHVVYFVAEVLPHDGERARVAITRDASETGLLLLTRAHVELGQSVTVRVHLPGDVEERAPVTGRVVRREVLSPHEVDFWKEKVALQFDAPEAELARDLLEAAARLQP